MMVRATHPCTSYQTRILLPPIASDIVLDLAVDWCRKWRLSLLSMTGSDSSGDYDNPDLLELIARLNIRDDEHPHPRPRTPPRPRIPPRLRTPPRPRTPPSTAAAQPPPYTPQNRPHTVSRPRTVPHVHAVPRIHAGTGETIYSIDSPRLTSTSGPVYTREWSIAGNATQAVPGGRVHVVARGTPSKKSRGPKKVAFVVFCGINYGVFLSWRETEPLVSGVRNCIFRGYVTLREAQAAFAYAHERGWTRIADPSRTSAIPALPLPISLSDAPNNPLNGDETPDSLWYVVYSGITPGVYRSHLECQLNTLGVRGSLYESIAGKDAAFSKFLDAQLAHTVHDLPPTYYV